MFASLSVRRRHGLFHSRGVERRHLSAISPHYVNVDMLKILGIHTFTCSQYLRNVFYETHFHMQHTFACGVLSPNGPSLGLAKSQVQDQRPFCGDACLSDCLIKYLY